MPSRPSPSKLFSLREWLTRDEAAKHLSIVFGEVVTPADVLRLALDGLLTLSVDFVNHADTRAGHLVALEQCPLTIYSRSADVLSGKLPLVRKKDVFVADLPNLEADIRSQLESGDLVISPQAENFGDNLFLLLDSEVTSIEGIWDLPMKGGERLDVEHLYQTETDGPAVTLTNLSGVYVKRDDVVCQLQNDYEDNEYSKGSKAHGELVERKIALQDLTEGGADELRRKYAEHRKQFLANRKSQTRSEKYYPAGRLPDDAVYVVRTACLREFELAVFGRELDPKKPPSKREESTLLNIIGGMLALMLGKTPAGKPHSVFESQASIINALLAEQPGKSGIAERTLQDKFAAAKRSLES
jgi:hypothetical protein